MSVQREQTQRVLGRIAHDLYSSGSRPTLLQILSRVQKHFSDNPAGMPLSMPSIANANSRSSSAAYNEMLDVLTENLDVLYKVSLKSVSDILELNNSLQTSLNALERRRSKLERRIDDFLLGLRNSDGYFYSVSDSFSDLEQVNLSLSNVEVDTEAGQVMIPSNPANQAKVPVDAFRSPQIDIQTEDGTNSFEEVASLSGAVNDKFSNLIWSFEVIVSDEQEVIATADIPLRDENGDPPVVSRVEIVPYSMESTQLTVFAGSDTDDLVNFGDRIRSGTGKMIFEQNAIPMGLLRLRFRKTDYDYFEHENGQTNYHYIFGARSLVLDQQSYARNAVFISQPYSMPDDLRDSMVIDAVSLVVDDDQTKGTDINYFVAASSAQGIEDINAPIWHRIRPIGSRDNKDRVVRFDGVARRTRAITEDPDSDELQAIPLQTDGPASEHNPTASIIAGSDIYRIAKFDENFLTSDISLVEGRNSTRIYSVEYDESAINSLGFWKDVIANDDPSLDFGRIDTGDGFFYGGDVGANGRSVYVETFVDSPIRRETTMGLIHKVDDRSKTWYVKVFLNGQQIADLPAGKHQQQAPWAFMQGRNHIIVLVQIPDDEDAPNAYTGRLNLMDEDNLLDFGGVYLARWNYVDIFDMRYNESSTSPPKTFTVYDGEVVSRRRPSFNMFLQYGTATGNQPESVVLRADMSRNRNTPQVSPRINQYRLRFSYGS